MSLTTASSAGAGTGPRSAAQPAAGGGSSPALLVGRLGAALAQAGVRYCQWKGHAKRARWEAGESDVDLLVERADAAVLSAVLERLGFKLALPWDRAETPGLLSWFGQDPALRRLVHLHVHFDLPLGRLWARHYRLPIQRAVLGATVERTWFRTPSPELELLLLVLHSTLRHRLRDGLRDSEPYWLRAAQPGLASLEAEADRSALERALAEHVPSVDLALFERARASLRPGGSAWSRWTARRALERALADFASGPPAGARVRRALALVLRIVGLSASALTDFDRRLVSGGAMIALVGADGAGKSTCAAALERWLAPDLRTRRVHLGRPPRSLLTLVVGALLKLGRRLDLVLGRRAPSRVTGLLELARHVATARDRFLLYRSVRRFTARGGLAICDRFPIPESYALAGPSAFQGLATLATGPLADRLRRFEAGYYSAIGAPDVTLVLRVDPATAVQRKTDEPADYVRRRALILQAADLSRRSLVVIDAARPIAEVAAEVRARVWEAL